MSMVASDSFPPSDAFVGWQKNQDGNCVFTFVKWDGLLNNY